MQGWRCHSSHLEQERESQFTGYPLPQMLTSGLGPPWSASGLPGQEQGDEGWSGKLLLNQPPPTSCFSIFQNPGLREVLKL